MVEESLGPNLLDVFEVVWLLAGVVGFGVSVFAVNDARQDHLTVERWAHVGTRTLVASANLRREYVRTAIYAIFVVIGILSVQLPPPPKVEFFRMAAALGFIAVEFLTVFNSIQDLRDRRVLYERIAQQFES